MKGISARLIFGFSILLATAVLAAIIALGNVKQETSYGLNVVLGSLSTMAGMFSQWAFSRKDDQAG